MKRLLSIYYFSALFLFCFFLTESMAAGIGFNVTGGGGSTKWDANNWSHSSSDKDFHFKTDNERAGIGFLFDTAVGNKRVFNYRLNIGTEAVDYKVKSVYKFNIDPNLNGTFETKGRFMSHDFGFKVFERKKLRIWLGPELRLSKIEGKLSGDKNYEVSISSLGLGPVLGVNLNIGKTLSLAIKVGALEMASYGDLDNHATGEDWDIYADNDHYIFANVGLLFRFGEPY